MKAPGYSTPEEAARIVNEAVTAMLERCREAMPDQAGAIVAGTMMAMVRFDTQHRATAGSTVTVREINADLFKVSRLSLALALAREAMPDQAGAIVAGAMMAMVRFDIQHRTTAGSTVTVREINADLFKVVNQCAEILLARPAGGKAS